MNLEIGQVADTQRLVITQVESNLLLAKRRTAAHYKQLMGIRRSNFLLVLLLMMQLSYLCFGAFMFCSFERPGELERRLHLKLFRSAFLRNYTCLNGEPNISLFFLLRFYRGLA